MPNIITSPYNLSPVKKVNVPISKLGPGKFSFVDKDAMGKKIETNHKGRKAIEVEGDSRFAGKRFIMGTKLYGDKRCLYCGVWFHWKDTDYQEWVKTKNIDRLNLDDVIEPLHCGSSHCHDYHHECIKAEENRLKVTNRKNYELYKYMQGQGLVD